MPLFARQDDDREGVYVDPRPEWRDRPLREDEVERCSVLLMAFLKRNGFAYRQIAQIMRHVAAVFPVEGSPRAARNAVENRLRAFRRAAEDAGFLESPVPA